jgi:hypothetical protein
VGKLEIFGWVLDKTRIHRGYLYLGRIQWLSSSPLLRDKVLERPLLLLIQCFVWLYSSTTHLIESNKRQLMHAASS